MNYTMENNCLLNAYRSSSATKCLSQTRKNLSGAQTDAGMWTWLCLPPVWPSSLEWKTPGHPITYISLSSTASLQICNLTGGIWGEGISLLFVDMHVWMRADRQTLCPKRALLHYSDLYHWVDCSNVKCGLKGWLMLLAAVLFYSEVLGEEELNI